jgi:hypothetical protein
LIFRFSRPLLVNHQQKLRPSRHHQVRR